MKLDKATRGLGLLILFVLSSCIKPAPEKEPWVLNINTPVLSKTAELTQTQKPQRTPFLPATREPGKPMQTPTPDAPKVMPTLRSDPEIYSVQMNDSLNVIARRYGVDMNSIISENQLTNPNFLEIGQVLIIPPPDPEAKGPDFKIIPDSELVFGPTSIGFDPYHLIYSFDSYLSSLDHSDEVAPR